MQSWRLSKSHSLPLQADEPRKASSIRQSKSKGLRTSSSDVQGQEKMDIPSQEARENSAFFCFFVQYGLSVQVYSVYWIKC